MKVIKRDGRLEDFSLDKIKRSICNASDDINHPLTQGDLKVICCVIEDEINSNYRETIPSNIIKGIVEKSLIENGFSEIATSYI